MHEPFRSRVPLRTAIALGACALLLAAAGPARAETDPHGGHAAEGGAAVPRTPRPADAELYFISPADGATVSNPVVVRFGLRGMGVAPAGVEHPNTGHHHLLIDVEPPRHDLPLPNDEQHLHFGGGQTEVSLELAPGRHELQLVLGDHNHVPHDPPLLSDRITITVE